MKLSCAAILTGESDTPAATPRSSTSIGDRIRVLLVEDSTETATLVRIYLRDEEDSFQIEWAPNLMEAMGRLGEPGISVVLLDLGLPELSGYRSYRAIQAGTRYKPPVVIFTSDDSVLSRALTMEFGAADYLLKGEVTPLELRNALRRAVLG
jgi:two-component system OmpR family response regulator